jgi:hypothetical protein
LKNNGFDSILGALHWGVAAFCAKQKGDGQHICPEPDMVIIAKNQMSFSKLSFVGKTFDLPLCRFWLAGAVSHWYWMLARERPHV